MWLVLGIFEWPSTQGIVVYFILWYFNWAGTTKWENKFLICHISRIMSYQSLDAFGKWMNQMRGVKINVLYVYKIYQNCNAIYHYAIINIQLFHERPLFSSTSNFYFMSETRELLNFQGRVFEACIEMQLDAAAWSDHITGFYAKNCLENLFSTFYIKLIRL